MKVHTEAQPYHRVLQELLRHFATLTEPQLAIVLGTEGDGLSTQVIEEMDYVVRIPMWHEVDSLNVAAASAVAFWELRAR